MRAVANNNPEGLVISAQVEEFLRNGGAVQSIPLGLGSQTPENTNRAKTEFENRQAIKKTNSDLFEPGIFNPNSAASKKAYSRGGKA